MRSMYVYSKNHFLYYTPVIYDSSHISYEPFWLIYNTWTLQVFQLVFYSYCAYISINTSTTYN
jgi:hypothetical protein